MTRICGKKRFYVNYRKFYLLSRESQKKLEGFPVFRIGNIVSLIALDYRILLGFMTKGTEFYMT